MKFKTDYERTKWAALQSSANASIKSIASGKGTSADAARVSSAMGQQSKLAKEVFDEGVSAVEASAKAAVKALNERRVSKGKAPLTAEAFGKLFEDAFARQMKKEVPSLIQDIHDTLLIELYEQDDRFRSTLSGQFERFKEHMAQGDQPSNDDMIALFDLNREITFKQEEVLWKQRSEGLLEKIADTFKDTLREVAASVQAARQRSAGASSGGSGMPRLAIAGPSGNWEVVDPVAAEASSDPKKLNAMSEPSGESSGSGSSLMSTVSQFMPRLSGPAAAHAETSGVPSSTLPMVSLSEKADAAIITAAEQQTAFHERISTALDQQERDRDDDDEDEDEEQVGWFRKLRTFLGDSYKKATKSDSWWETAAKTLLAAMTDPGLFEEISKKVQDILTWDNIKNVLSSTIEWAWQKGNDMVEWVLGKLGLGTPGATDNVDSYRHDDGKGASLVQTDAQRLAAANAIPDPFHSGGTGGATPENADPNAHSSIMSTINNWTGKHLGFRMDKSDASNIGGATGSTLNMGDSIMPSADALNPEINKTTPLADSVDPTINKTTVVGGKTVSVQNGAPVTYKGVPATQPTTGAATSPASGAARGRAPSPSQQVGLGSIPTTSGIDDSLAITNLGLMM